MTVPEAAPPSPEGMHPDAFRKNVEQDGVACMSVRSVDEIIDAIKQLLVPELPK